MARTRAILMAAVVMAVVPLGGVRGQSAAQKADELVQRAQALEGDVAAYTVAATLYEHSAAFRSRGDARGVEALITAGRLYAYAGEGARALTAMEAGAARALKDGDAVTAAHAYADAAYIAAARHDPRAVELAQKVIKLADYWVPEDRPEILARLGRQVVSLLRMEPNPVMVLALR